MHHDTSHPSTDYARSLLRHLTQPEVSDGTSIVRSPTTLQLLYAARLAFTFEDIPGTRATAAPMTITAIKASSEFDRSTLADFAELILAGMSDLCGLDLITNTSVIFVREGKDRARAYLERDLNSAIAGGKSVIAIISDQDDLPDSARYLPRCNLSLSPITGDIIAEVMRVTWKASTRRLTAMLRQHDPKIASLPYCVILGALEQIEPGRTVETVIKALERGAQPPDGPSLDDLYLPKSLQDHMDAVLTDITDFRAGVVA